MARPVVLLLLLAATASMAAAGEARTALAPAAGAICWRALPMPPSARPSSPPANTTYTKVYTDFYTGVSATSDATYCKQIIGGWPRPAPAGPPVAGPTASARASRAATHQTLSLAPLCAAT